MKQPFIFVSCGQFAEAEKRLGLQIVDLVKTITGLDAFFAEDVQDLNGLDTNILSALRDCAGFITVLHPRGEITRPDGTRHVRASVWIKQEIAIATYIQRVEKRALPVIAFIHESVGREGIRDLLHLNPQPFADESDILVALAKRLSNWKGLSGSGIHVQLKSVSSRVEQEHFVSRLETILVNDSNLSITKLDGLLRIPAGILSHWSTHYPAEVKCQQSDQRCFRFSERNFGSIAPHQTRSLLEIDYCPKCALRPGEPPAAVCEAKVYLQIWIDGREYAAEDTIQGLAERREAR